MGRTVFPVLLLALMCGSVLAAEAQAPIAMSDPGGQGLDLDTLDVRLAAHGPLALTELEMVFRNPLDRQIEGKFVCMLPTGATISRFAKEVDGKLVEGEVVERLKATQAYTESLHSMQNPALLEQDQGNRFKARIFPISPKGTVRLVLSYSTVNPIGTDGQRRITVPLKGLPKIGQFKFLAVCRPLPGESVQLADASGASRALGTKDRITFAEEAEQKSFESKQDLTLAFAPGPQAQAVSQLVAGGFQMSVFRPPVKEAVADRSEDWTVLVDTSASQASQGKARLAALGKVLETLGSLQAGREVAVEAFDLATAPVLKAKGAELKSAALVELLEKRHFLGATNLEKVLGHIGELARKASGPSSFLLVTDGIATMGSKETGALVKALGQWPEKASLSVLVIGSTQDESVTKAITTAGRDRIVTVGLTTEWEEQAKRAATELVGPLGKRFEVYDEGAEWIEPKEFLDVRPGVELIAFSKIKDGAKTQVGATDGKGLDLRPTMPAVDVPDFSVLVEREAYRAQLALLERQETKCEDAGKRAELRKRRLDISVRYRVVCPLTAMLVLESEQDYARYGIDRTALADIMTVGPKGVELTKRNGGEPPKPVVAPEPPRLRKKAMGRSASRMLDSVEKEANLSDKSMKLESTTAGEERQSAPEAKADESAPTGGAPAAPSPDLDLAPGAAGGRVPEPPAGRPGRRSRRPGRRA